MKEILLTVFASSSEQGVARSSAVEDLRVVPQAAGGIARNAKDRDHGLADIRSDDHVQDHTPKLIGEFKGTFPLEGVFSINPIDKLIWNVMCVNSDWKSAISREGRNFHAAHRIPGHMAAVTGSTGCITQN